MSMAEVRALEEQGITVCENCAEYGTATPATQTLVGVDLCDDCAAVWGPPCERHARRGELVKADYSHEVAGHRLCTMCGSWMELHIKATGAVPDLAEV